MVSIELETSLDLDVSPFVRLNRSAYELVESSVSTIMRNKGNNKGNNKDDKLLHHSDRHFDRHFNRHFIVLQIECQVRLGDVYSYVTTT